MAVPGLSFTGWSTASIAPTPKQIRQVQVGIRPSIDPALASRRVAANGATGGSPASDAQANQANQGAANATTATITPVAAASNLGLVDKSLGSRASGVPNPAPSSIVASGSVYQSPDIPAFLAGSVDALNQSAVASNSTITALLNQILQGGLKVNTSAVPAAKSGVQSALEAREAANQAWLRSQAASAVPAYAGTYTGTVPTVNPFSGSPMTGTEMALAARNAGAATWQAQKDLNAARSAYYGSAWVPAPATNTLPRVV